MNRKATRYNSKLSDDQRQWRKNLKAKYKEYGLEIFSFPSLGVTIAVLPSDYPGSRASYGVAVMSEQEKKFRRKVGEYHALQKLDDVGEDVHLPDFVSLKEWAEKKAHRVSRLAVDME